MINAFQIISLLLEFLLISNLYQAYAQQIFQLTFVQYLSKAFHTISNLQQPKLFHFNFLISFSYVGKNYPLLIIIIMDQLAKQDSIQVAIRIKQSSSVGYFDVVENSIKADKNIFNFDRIFAQDVGQEEIFQAIGKQNIQRGLSGLNSAIFVYGQTGSGKTYTMMGSKEKNETGILQKTFKYLFQNIFQSQVKKYTITSSFYEIYNEKISDLLNDKSSNKISIHQNVEKGVYLKGGTQIKCYSAQQMFQCLEKGCSNRKIASTNMNMQSSRSHSIFTISINIQEKELIGKKIISSKLCFVDLAGSERQKLTSTSGDRLKQAAHINKSLTTLGIVINGLTDKKSHIPYRDSKLTYILKNCLGGSAKTVIIGTISNSQQHLNQSLLTLAFATRTKQVKSKLRYNVNNAGINLEDAINEISSLKKELCFLKMKEQQNQKYTKQLQEKLKIKQFTNQSKKAFIPFKQGNQINQQQISQNPSLLREKIKVKQLQLHLNNNINELYHIGLQQSYKLLLSSYLNALIALSTYINAQQNKSQLVPERFSFSTKQKKAYSTEQLYIDKENLSTNNMQNQLCDNFYKRQNQNDLQALILGNQKRLKKRKLN